MKGIYFMKTQNHIGLLLSLFFSIAPLAQAQNSVFYVSESDSSFLLPDFGLELSQLSFIKNNEYFNDISDGLTLLGAQVHPEFIYKPSERTQFRSGLFLFKHFGEESIDKAIPTFSFKYVNEKHRFTIGNLFARDNHRMIEPMMASEKLLSSDVLESGIAYQYTSMKVRSELWLDWENYIRKQDNEREVFTLGSVSRVTISDHLSLPIQFLLQHKGGQINKRYNSDTKNSAGTSNAWNASLGIEYKLLNFLNNEFLLSYYFLHHQTASNLLEYPFEKGDAHYLTLNYKLKDVNFLLGYYQADQFVSLKGNEMFQTYSQKTNINYWNGVLDQTYLALTEPDRELMFTKLFYEKILAPKVKLGIQWEGFLQLNDSSPSLATEKNKKHQLDHSFGIYIIFNDVFEL